MIDAAAQQSHFADHIKPVWLALPPEVRGKFYISGTVRAHRDMPNVVIGAPPPSSTPTLVASTGDLKRLHGRPAALMEHGCGQSFGGDPRRSTMSSYAGGEKRDGASLFLHPGHHPAGRDRVRYPSARVEVVGCPKLDDLPRKRHRGEPPVVAVSFHWMGPGPEAQGAWRYFDRQLVELSKVTRWKVIGHGHPRIMRKLAVRYQRLGIEVVTSFEDVCRRADVYVNDCSSTLYEFASTGRPVVVLNPRIYRRNIDHGLRFWEASSVGVNCGQEDDLLEAIRDALRDTPIQQAERERCVNLVYAYREGAAQRAAAALMDWAANAVQRAA